MSNDPESTTGITKLVIDGFKSIRSRAEIEIRPLTILAGANSSGKSSVVQPLLLLKQTLEVPFDPGALLLDGPNVSFTKVEQFLCRQEKNQYQDLRIGVEVDDRNYLINTFRFRQTKSRREMQLIEAVSSPGSVVIKPDMSEEEIVKIVPDHLRQIQDQFQAETELLFQWQVVRGRCFLYVELSSEQFDFPFKFVPFGGIDHIRQVIHVPGLRRRPERTYLVTPAQGPIFHGTFEHYIAGIISRWQANRSRQLPELGAILEELGLTWKISSERVDDTQVELRVGRLRHAAQGGAHDLVNIADVGFGVSQVLPVLVALLVARKGQLVYVEQPELHLHPKAQVALAGIIASAAKRGVRVVVETHSSLLLLGIQTLIAKKELDHQLVKLHWFELDDEGCTQITSTDVDETGRYGDWPEDFGDVDLNAQSDFLDAVEALEMSV
ncbi:MAG: AAA family ATPase [Chloroflexi bacterium]|nr:AAA family ATPase [Chloroflexota bacterium]